MEEKKTARKYQRREFIKSTAKVGAGTALYGAVGYGIGRGYKAGRDSYRENVKPYVEKGKEIIDAAEGTKDRLGNWWDKYIRKKQEEEPEIEKQRQAEEKANMSRRGFLSKYFHLFNEHPVATGTATGVALGGLVSSLKLYPKYLDKKKVAKLRDDYIELKNENALNGEQIKILKEYKENLERASTERDQKIKGLENELQRVYKVLNMNEKGFSGLEEKTKSDDELKSTLSILLSGIGLIIGFVLINGIDYTGLVTLSTDSMYTSNFLGIIIIFTSLALIIIGGLRLRKISKRKHF